MATAEIPEPTKRTRTTASKVRSMAEKGIRDAMAAIKDFQNEITMKEIRIQIWQDVLSELGTDSE